MKVEFDNNIPIYIQLVDYLKKCIISGKLKPGERLLSVRDLATLMKVNPNTMQRALTDLEELKLIYRERTSGKFVTKDQRLISKYRDEYTDNLAKNFLKDMENYGFSYREVMLYLNKIKGGE